MAGYCKHFAKRPETDLQEFELVAKNTKYKSQPVCCSCREGSLAEETRHIKILDDQKESLILCNESHDTIRPIKFPDSPVKHLGDGSTLLNISNTRPRLSPEGHSGGLENYLGTLFHIGSVLEAKIKSQTRLSDDLGALSLFTIQQAGEGARINGLNAIRSHIDKKTSSLEISAALGQCCLALTCLMNAYNFNFPNVFLLPAGPYSRISVSKNVYPLYIPSSKHPTQLEDFDLGLLGLFKLVETFSATIQIMDSDIQGMDEKFEMKHRDQKISAILEKLDKILKID